MSSALFELSNVENDPEWIVKEFFNSVYFQGKFVSIINAISEHRSCVINEDYCVFPESESFDPDLHFDGVKFGIMDDQIVVSFDVFQRFLNIACARYLKLHPEDVGTIKADSTSKCDSPRSPQFEVGREQ